MQVQSLGREDSLEESMAIHSVLLPGESLGQRNKESGTTEVTHAHTRDKGLSMKIKGLIQEEDITTVNVYAPSIGAP